MYLFDVKNSLLKYKKTVKITKKEKDFGKFKSTLKIRHIVILLGDVAILNSLKNANLIVKKYI